MSHSTVYKIESEEQKRIFKTFSKSDNEIQEDIMMLKEWLKKQPHLPQDEDENRLRTILCLNKFSLEKAKKKLDMYYSVKNVSPELFTDREPLNPAMNEFLNSVIFTPLPNLNKNLCRVYVFEYDCSPEKFDSLYFMKFVFSTLDLRITYDCCLGDHFVINLKDSVFGHFVHLTPVYIKKIFTLLEKGYSDRFKSFHFVHAPAVANIFISLLNTIASEKLANRVYVHKDYISLHEHIAKEILPFEYGGTYGNLRNIYDEWKAFLRSKNIWLLEEGKRRSDESKRQGEPFNNDLFGMYGSFRQIMVD